MALGLAPNNPGTSLSAKASTGRGTFYKLTLDQNSRPANAFSVTVTTTGSPTGYTVLLEGSQVGDGSDAITLATVTEATAQTVFVSGVYPSSVGCNLSVLSGGTNPTVTAVVTPIAVPTTSTDAVSIKGVPVASLADSGGRVLSLSADGSQIDPAAPAILQHTVTLTEGQIKALPVTPVEILPAPGANKVYLFHSALVIKPTTVAHNNRSTADAYVAFQVAGVPVSSSLPNISGGVSYYEGFFGGTVGVSLFRFLPFNQQDLTVNDWGNIAAPYQSGSDSANAPLVFMAYNNDAGPLTDGDAANTLTIIIYYSIVDVS